MTEAYKGPDDRRITGLLGSATSDLDETAAYTGGSPDMGHLSTRANTHATMALVLAQQEANRLANIANLIALHQSYGNNGTMRDQIRRHIEAAFPEPFSKYTPPRVQDAR